MPDLSLPLTPEARAQMVSDARFMAETFNAAVGGDVDATEIAEWFRPGFLVDSATLVFRLLDDHAALLTDSDRLAGTLKEAQEVFEGPDAPSLIELPVGASSHLGLVARHYLAVHEILTAATEPAPK